MRFVATLLVLLWFNSPEAKAQAHGAEKWRGKVIYFALVDRFANGDHRNDQVYGDPVCNNPNDAHAFQGGDLSGLAERLSYIKELGVSAIWVSPLYRGVPGRQGANCGFPGYWADFDVPYRLALDPRFGGAEDFDRLLNQSHQMGLQVMLDMVVNHAGYNSQAVRQRPDWFADQRTCGQMGDPTIFCPLAELPDFLHRRDDVKQYLIDLHLEWLRRFPLDGIRMDTVKHVEPWYFSLWNQSMRAERGDLYILGELFDEHSLDSFHSYLNAGFDGLFNFPLRTSLIQTFAWGGSVDQAVQRVEDTLARFGDDRADLLVNLLDNHDVRRFLEEIPSGISGREVMQRYHLALAALLTLPGIPQIYYGNEVGMYGGSDPDNRRFMPEWAFDERGRSQAHSGFVADPQGTFAFVRRVLQVRNENPALQIGRYYELWRQNGSHNPNVWAYLRHDEQSQRHAVVVFNNGDRALDEPLSIGTRGFFADGTVLINQLHQQESVQVEGGRIRVSLPAKAVAIFFVQGE